MNKGWDDIIKIPFLSNPYQVHTKSIPSPYLHNVLILQSVVRCYFKNATIHNLNVNSTVWVSSGSRSFSINAYYIHPRHLHSMREAILVPICQCLAIHLMRHEWLI